MPRLVPITPALCLSEPRLRYTHAGHPRSPVQPHSVSGWARNGNNGWTWCDSVVAVSAHVEAVGQATGLRFSLQPCTPVRIEVCAVELVAQTPEPPFIVDAFQKWRPLRGMVTLNECSPLLVRWRTPERNTAELRSVRGAIACKLLWNKHQLKAVLYLDAAALHPRWQYGDVAWTSTAAPTRDVGQKLEVFLLASSIDAAPENPGYVVSRYPDGSEACFTIVDHCDFDTSDRLRTFLYGDEARHGWIGRGLRMTKSVFTLATEVALERRAGCLAEADYRELIRVLQADGSEIAPHALRQAGPVEPAVFTRTLDEFSEAWRGRTWIDHGRRIEYCYAMGGASHSGYHLLERLRANRFTTLWAYHDLPMDARALNMLAPRRTPFLGPVLHHLAGRRAGVALHYLRTAIEQRLQGVPRYAVQEICSTLRILAMRIRAGRFSRSEVVRTWSALVRIMASSWNDAQLLAEPYTLRELMEMPAIVYPERGVPLNQGWPDELVLFATAETPHAGDVYTNEGLQSLRRQRGLHLGHTYLLNELPYISGLFQRDGGRLRLKPAWSDFVEALSTAVSRRHIWNPTASEVSEWFRAMQQVTCIPSGEWGLCICNRSADDIRGFTILLPPGTPADAVEWSSAPPKGSRDWGDWLAVWGDLPARSETTVQWGPHTSSARHENRNPIAVLSA